MQAIADAVLSRPRQGAPSGDLGVCLLGLGGALLEHGDRDAAERVWMELRELAERTRDASLRVGVRATDAWPAFLEGRLERAALLVNEVLALAAEVGTAASGIAFRPEILVYLGRNQEVLALPALVNPAGRANWAQATWCLGHLGRHDEARVLRQRFGDVGSETDETSSSMLALIV